MVDVREVPDVVSTGRIRVTSETATFYHFQNRRVSAIQELANEPFTVYRLNSNEINVVPDSSEAPELRPSSQPSRRSVGQVTSSGSIASTLSARTFDEFMVAALVSREIRTDGTLRGITYCSEIGVDLLETPAIGSIPNIAPLSNIGFYGNFGSGENANQSMLLDIHKIRTSGTRMFAFDGVPTHGVETIEGSVPITDDYTIINRITAITPRFNIITGMLENVRVLNYPAASYVTEVTTSRQAGVDTVRRLFVSRISDNSSATLPSNNQLAWSPVLDYDSTFSYSEGAIVGRGDHLFMNNRGGSLASDPFYNVNGLNWHVSNTLSDDSGVIEYVTNPQVNPDNTLVIRDAAPARFSTSRSYVIGQQVLSANGRIYEATANVTANIANNEPENDTVSWTEAVFNHGDVVVNNGGLGIVNNTNAANSGSLPQSRIDNYSAAILAQPFTGIEYDPISTFSFGERVVYDNELYDANNDLNQLAQNRDPTNHLGDWQIIPLYVQGATYAVLQPVRTPDDRFFLSITGNPSTSDPEPTGVDWAPIEPLIDVEEFGRDIHYPAGSIATFEGETYFTREAIEANGDNDFPGQPAYTEITTQYAANTAYPAGTTLLYRDDPTQDFGLFTTTADIPDTNVLNPNVNTDIQVAIRRDWRPEDAYTPGQFTALNIGAGTMFYVANINIPGTFPQPSPSNENFYELHNFFIRTEYDAGEFVVNNERIYRARVDIPETNTMAPAAGTDWQLINAVAHNPIFSYTPPPTVIENTDTVDFTTTSYATFIDDLNERRFFIPLIGVSLITGDFRSPIAVDPHYRLTLPNALIWSPEIAYPLSTVVCRPNGLIYELDQDITLANNTILPESTDPDNPWVQITNFELITFSRVVWNGRREYRQGDIVSTHTLDQAIAGVNIAFEAVEDIPAPADNTVASNQSPLLDTARWRTLDDVEFRGDALYPRGRRVIERGRVYETVHPTSGVRGNQVPALDPTNWTRLQQRPFGEILFNEEYVTDELQLYEGALIRARRDIPQIFGRDVGINDSPYNRLDEYQILGGRVHYDARRFVRVRNQIDVADGPNATSHYFSSDFTFYEYTNFNTRGSYVGEMGGLAAPGIIPFNELPPANARLVEDHSLTRTYSEGEHVQMLETLYVSEMNDNTGNDPRANTGHWRRVYGVEEFEVGQNYNSETIAWIGDSPVRVINNNVVDGEINHTGFNFETDISYGGFEQITQWVAGSSNVSAGSYRLNRGGVYRALADVSGITEPSTSPGNYRLISLPHFGYFARNGNRYINSYARNRSVTADQLIAIRFRAGNTDTNEFFNHYNGTIDTMEITANSGDNRVDISFGYIFEGFSYDPLEDNPNIINSATTSELTPISLSQGERGTLRFREPVTSIDSAAQFVPLDFGYSDITLSTSNNSEIQPQALLPTSYATSRRTFEATGNINSYWGGDNPLIGRIYNNTTVELNYFLRTPGGNIYTFYYPATEITEGTPTVSGNNETMRANYAYRCTGVNLINTAIEIGFFDAILVCE